MAKAGAVEGNTFSGEMGVGAVLNSTRWALTRVTVARGVVVVVVLKEEAGEMAVWIGEPRGHAVVT